MMDSPTAQEARDAVLRLDGHPLDMRVVDRFIDEHDPMKQMTHDEQNDLADELVSLDNLMGQPVKALGELVDKYTRDDAPTPESDADYLPVHKDVVAALRERLNEARRLLDGANPQTKEQ